jgi:hypothetical protein
MKLFILISLSMISQANAVPIGGAGGMNWSCTAGGTTCVCEGGRGSLDCKDMVSITNGSVCRDMTPTPADTLTCDVHGRCSCIASSVRKPLDRIRPVFGNGVIKGNLRVKQPVNKTSPNNFNSRVNSNNIKRNLIVKKSAPAYSSKMIGGGGLNWNCTSGSTICTCSGGENSDDCSDLNSRMCGGGINDLTCNTVGTCSCTRAKKGITKRPKISPVLGLPKKMAPTSKHRNARPVRPTAAKRNMKISPKNSRPKPVVQFDEADAVFGKRSDTAKKK